MGWIDIRRAHRKNYIGKSILNLIQKQINGTENSESLSIKNLTQDKLSFYIPANSVEKNKLFLKKIKIELPFETAYYRVCSQRKWNQYV